MTRVAPRSFLTDRPNCIVGYRLTDSADRAYSANCSTPYFWRTVMANPTAKLRQLLAEERFIDMPVAYDPLGGRLIESLGFKTVYNGGFVTGSSRCTSEPLLTMDEQVRTACDIAKTVNIPLVADAGAGFGEPLHAMRTVREFIHAGIAGIHIEDQLYPKRAHYHKYVAHVIPRKDFVDKIRFACRLASLCNRDFAGPLRRSSCLSHPRPRRQGLGLDDRRSRRHARSARFSADITRPPQ